jgi:anti-sigma regulatory factor (Ser/Thr protein kinase)/PAS domain-containing protein
MILIFAQPLSAEIITITDNFNQLTLGNKFEFLEDHEGVLTIEQINSDIFDPYFEKSHLEIPYFGFSQSTYWIRVSIENKTIYQTSLLLQLNFAIMDNVTFYSPLEDGSYYKTETGYIHNFNSRPIKHRTFLFPIELASDQTAEYYLKVSSKDRIELPLILWEYNSFYEHERDIQFAIGVYSGFIIVLILINIVLYSSLKDSTFLFHSFFILSFIFFQMSQNGLVFEYLTPPDFTALNHHIPFDISLLLISMLLFSTRYLKVKSQFQLNFIYSLSFLIFITGFSQILLPYHISIMILIFFSFFSIFTAMVLIVNSIRKGYKPAQYFAAGMICMMIGGLIFALKITGLLPSVALTNYSLYIGSNVHFLLLTFGLGIHINAMYKAKILAENKANATEERYKTLVEGSDEFVFTLDNSWTFLTANRASKVHLRTRPNELIGTSLFDLIFASNEKDRDLTAGFIQQKLESLEELSKPVEFTIPCRAKDMMEFKNVHFKIEKITLNGKSEIFGKGVSVSEDFLMRYFYYEHQVYRIENYLLSVIDITQRITRNLSRYMKEKTVNFIKIALHEIIVNAIEHGNLAISYNEKTVAKENNNYFQFIANRRTDPKYSNRKVTIDYVIDDQKAEYTITDEGEGFDYKKYVERGSETANNVYDSHGRGIIMAKNIFDIIRYNKKGNSVTLIKKVDKY